VKGAFSMKFTVERDVLAEAVGWTARSLPLRQVRSASQASITRPAPARSLQPMSKQKAFAWFPARSWQKFADPYRMHPSSSPQMNP